MAVFNEKSANAGEKGVPGLSIIGAGMRVVGDISADGVVKIEGSVNGTVRAAKQVLVARGGEVEGDVVSKEAIIGGEVRGAIYAEERLELQTASVVHGDVLGPDGVLSRFELDMVFEAGHHPHHVVG